MEASSFRLQVPSSSLKQSVVEAVVVAEVLASIKEEVPAVEAARLSVLNLRRLNCWLWAPRLP